jgi:hypothetical protein
MTTTQTLSLNQKAFMPINKEQETILLSMNNTVSFQLADENFKIRNAGNLLSRFFIIGINEIQKDITRLLIDLNRLPVGLEAKGERVLLYELFDFINLLEEQTTITVGKEGADKENTLDSELKEKYDSLMTRNIELLEDCVQLREDLARLREGSLVENS